MAQYINHIRVAMKTNEHCLHKARGSKILAIERLIWLGQV